MGSLNKVMLIGNLGRDPEMRYMTSGDAVCTLSIATQRRWTDKDSGEKKEQTDWHRCVAFGKKAEPIGEYMRKGSQMYIEGNLQTKKWTDKDGKERYTTEITVDHYQFLGGKGKPEQGEEPGGSEKPPATTKDAPKKTYGTESGSSSRKKAPAAAGAFGDLEDDIPF